MMMNENHVYKTLLRVETDGSRAADMRRVIRDDRMMLQTALRSGDRQRINAAAREGVETLRMWGVDIRG